tara:strand:+ start:966 stop:1247 length:282 start_codon:yes stop_codon:yes gene_type:complete
LRFFAANIKKKRRRYAWCKLGAVIDLFNRNTIIMNYFLLSLFFIFSTYRVCAQKLSNEPAADKFIADQIKQKNIAGAVGLPSKFVTNYSKLLF